MHWPVDKKHYMPHTSSSPQRKEQKRDDRLIVLLGIGILLLFIYCFQNFQILHLTIHKNFKLRWNSTGLFVEEARQPLLPSTEEVDNRESDILIPAIFTPVFFAPLPINEADQRLLETLPGIGPSLASEIIKTRSLQGPFRNPEDLLNIRGVGRKRMLKFADQFSFR